MDNSPATLASRQDVWRPAVLTSSSGVPTILRARRHAAVFPASLQNVKALVEYLAGFRRPVAVIGAGTRGAFREEDQLGCAMVVAGLMTEGFVPADGTTLSLVEDWAGERIDAILTSESAKWLAANDKQADVAFVLENVNNLDLVVTLAGSELVKTQ